MRRFLAVWIFVSMAASPAWAQKKTPYVNSVHAPASVMQGLEGKPRAARNGEHLVEKAQLETGPGGQLGVQLFKSVSLLLESGTRVILPGILREEGRVPRVLFDHGRLRWTSDGSDCTAELISSLFRLAPCTGDFLFVMEPGVPRAMVYVYRGEIEFSAANAEVSRVVKEGEKVAFTGVLENGEVAADILLRGKKIPRGQLGPVEKMTAAEWGSIKAEARKKEIKNQKVKADQLKQKLKDQKEGVICSKPVGKLNECAWVCEGASGRGGGCPVAQGARCVRKRCNANGLWADPMVLSADDGARRCKRVPVVGKCDY